jgi:TRAP-type C4-dicarboxylate transport system substrate-binding protein
VLVLLGLAAVVQAEPAKPAAGRPAGLPREHLRVVGGLAALSQYTRHEVPFWTERLPALTGGRVTAEIAPFDRSGIRGQELLRLVQLGVAPYATVSLATGSTVDPVLNAADLAGLNPDFDVLRSNVQAFRPYLARALRERHGAELLAIYAYPAQVIFCRQPMRRLADLAGRRVRTTSPTQADFVEALGGIPVHTGFEEIVANVRGGNLDCAITGTMSGNTVGLHEVTGYIHAMAVTWGLSAFVANRQAWQALAEPTRALLRRELAALEQAIWQDAWRETGEGLACNTGRPQCVHGRRGQMVQAPGAPEDEARRREVLGQVVLQRWGQRCGASCLAVWNETLAPVTGLRLR